MSQRDKWAEKEAAYFLENIRRNPQYYHERAAELREQSASTGRAQINAPHTITSLSTGYLTGINLIGSYAVTGGVSATSTITSTSSRYVIPIYGEISGQIIAIDLVPHCSLQYLTVANCIAKLGSKHHPLAAVFYEMAAAGVDATYSIIIKAAQEMENLIYLQDESAVGD